MKISVSGPRWIRRSWVIVMGMALLAAAALPASGQPATTAPATRESGVRGNWPPAIEGADERGVVRLEGEGFLVVPDEVNKALGEVEGCEFVVARAGPSVELTYHRELPGPGVGPDNGTGWTSWGDICAASDGSVYVAIGDHGRNMPAEGKPANAQVMLYRWDAAKHELRQVADLNAIVGATGNDPRWSKVHAGIHEGSDGAIYLTPTLNDGQRAANGTWTERVPTGQVLRFDPATGQTRVVALLPPGSATATSEYDVKRNILYYNLEGAHTNALFALDLGSLQPVFQGPDAMITHNRNMAMAADGAIYFNAADGQIGKYDPHTRQIGPSGMVFPNGAAMRCSTPQTPDGWIYGATYQGTEPGRLFRLHPENKTVEMLGPDFLAIDAKGKASAGNYTTVAVLSPDGRFVYYLPGAHGGAVRIGCPVVQYDVAAGKRKVIAFLRDVMERKAGYVPGGTYGIALSPDGSTLYVNFNGHATEAHRLERMKPNGFGLTAFAAIHIPASER